MTVKRRKEMDEKRMAKQRVDIDDTPEAGTEESAMRGRETDEREGKEDERRGEKKREIFKETKKKKKSTTTSNFRNSNLGRRDRHAVTRLQITPPLRLIVRELLPYAICIDAFPDVVFGLRGDS